MFNSVVLDVVIGLVFIYLLYSLLVTIVSELIATFLGLRARNLKEAIDRMLNDEQTLNWWRRLFNSLRLAKNKKKNPVVNAFYNQPEIKYLGSSGLFKLPSTFDAASFAKSLLTLFAGDHSVTNEILNKKLGKQIEIKGLTKKGENVVKNMDPDTAKYIKDLWEESNKDVEQFKKLLENWFDQTMKHTGEWYKRKIRVITLLLGFLLAWFFNADTFVMVNKLSVDKTAREQMVSMANAYVQSHPVLDANQTTDTALLQTYTQRLDSLLAVKKQLQTDINTAGSVLGIGSFPADTVKVMTTKNQQGEKVVSYVPLVDQQCVRCGKEENGLLVFTFWDKVSYLFCLFYHHFWGFLVTAIAISLGAPFWFDLLSKIMKVKTSLSEDSKQKKTGATS